MAGLSLRQAATAAGTSKTSILRALQSGRMSGTRTDGGGWSIDPAELYRVFEPKPVPLLEAGPPDRTTEGAPVGQTVPAVLELLVRVRHLEEQLADRDRRTEELRQDRDRRIEELSEDRDRWHEAATKALERPLMLPAPEPGFSKTRFWWPWRRSA